MSKRYAICNLRGGIGKTTLTFNVSSQLSRNKKVLCVDSCPQENLTEICLRDHFVSSGTIKPNLSDALIAYIIQKTKLNKSQISVKATGLKGSLSRNDLWVFPSSPDLYLFPNILYNQLNMANQLPMEHKINSFVNILTSLDNILASEENSINPDYTIIDTSPFFAGATHLVLHACEELIVPVRADHQSIVSLELLLTMLTSPEKEYLKYVAATENAPVLKIPKIKMVVLTHCGWSRLEENTIDSSTSLFYDRVYSLINRFQQLFTSFSNKEKFKAEEHIVLLDDFLTSARISNEKCIPLYNLDPGQKFTISGTRLTVNSSVERYQAQLKHLISKL